MKVRIPAKCRFNYSLVNLHIQEGLVLHVCVDSEVGNYDEFVAEVEDRINDLIDCHCVVEGGEFSIINADELKNLINYQH